MENKKRHVLASLREAIGMKQTAFAALVGCSPATIQSIELSNGRLKLSEKLAQKIGMETGISVGWLMRNDPSEPAITESGKPYTQQQFDYTQSRLRGPKVEPQHYESAQRRLVFYLEAIARLIVIGHRSDTLGLVFYKLDRFLKEVRDEFVPLLSEEHRAKRVEITLPPEVIEGMRSGMQDIASEIFDMFNGSLMGEFIQKNCLQAGKEVSLECLGATVLIRGTEKGKGDGSSIRVTVPNATLQPPAQSSPNSEAKSKKTLRKKS